MSDNLENNIAIYIHWPFCKSKCPYCDFNSHVASDIKYLLWLKAYRNQISKYLPYLKNKKIISIFFGGGTPSLMPFDLLNGIISYLRDNLDFADDIEITLEANPTSSEADKFIGYKESGVNRLSLGVQSFIEQDLKFLGRNHSVTEAIDTIKMAKNIFDNFSFDLIYTRPNQTLESWRKELDLAISLAAKHISLYQLTIEKGTQFYSDYNKNKFVLPNDDISVELYLYTKEALQQVGIMQYEISNYACLGYESKHNLAYWLYKDYLGIGPGAHSRISYDANKLGFVMHHNPDKWLSLALEQKDTLQQKEILDTKVQLQEMILMGMRLNQGINTNKILSLAPNFSLELIPSYLIKEKLIYCDNESIRISDKGRPLSNSIISKLVEVIAPI